MVGFDLHEKRKLTTAEHGLAGAVSGVVTRVVLQPLDVLKIRFQVSQQVGITVKSNPGCNSDIDNRSDPDLVLLHMLSGCLHQIFNHHLADQPLKTDGVLHTKTA